MAEALFDHPEYRALVPTGLARPHHFRWAVDRQRFLERERGVHTSVRALLEKQRYLVAMQEGKEAWRDADDMRLTRALPPNLLIRLQFVPLRLDAGVLHIAPAMPLSVAGRADLLSVCRSSGFDVTEVREEPAPVHWIRKHLADASDDNVIPFPKAIGEVESDLENADAVQRALYALLADALRRRASDLSVRLTSTEVVIRYCIDGDYSTRHFLRFEVGQTILGQVKLKSGIHDAERGTPQDGRMEYSHQGRDIDIRVACCSTLSGEYMTARLLDPAQWGSLEEILVCAPLLLACVLRVLRRGVKSGGALMWTGPTSHGKSTSLASTLTEIDREKYSVFTVEKPVELRIPGVEQCEVANLPGRSFAEWISHILRQNPKVIALSEIRDAETVAEWLHVLDSGHLAPVTLHGDAIFDAINRVIGYLDETAAKRAAQLICEKLIVLVNQRLFKRVCICSSEDAPTEEERGLLPADVTTVRRANPDGCPLCENEGYRDRVCLPEYLIMPSMAEDGERRDAIIHAFVEDRRTSAIIGAAGTWYHPRSEAADMALRMGLIDVPTYLEAVTL